MDQNLSPGLDLRGGAPESAIADAEDQLRWTLPKDYREFLIRANGGEGFVGESYVILWATEELAQFNKEYQVDEYAPGLTLFGSDGGGEGFAFDRRSGVATVVQVPFIGMALEYARPVADSFDQFLIKLAK